MKNFRKFIVIVLMALVTVSLVACSQKKSALEDVKVTFKGYDGHGYMEGDSKKITSNMIDIMAKKAKLDDYLTEKLKDVVETDAADYDLEKDATSDERDSLVKVERWMKEIKIRSSKKENLKNGDKVRITIKTGDKDNPVKEETKTYTVKGLKKTKKVSAKDIAKNLDVQAYGYNGKGLIAITSKKYKGEVMFHIKNNGSLKNGDKVTIKLPSEFTSDEKIDFQGKKEFTYTVQGLKELAATKILMKSRRSLIQWLTTNIRTVNSKSTSTRSSICISCRRPPILITAMKKIRLLN